jgi:hypothetical protein
MKLKKKSIKKGFKTKKIAIKIAGTKSDIWKKLKKDEFEKKIKF